MKNNKSFEHIKNSAEWRAEEIKIKEGIDAFNESQGFGRSSDLKNQTTEAPLINEETSLDDADYITYDIDGKFVFFSVSKNDFAGNDKVLSRDEIEEVSQAAYDVFEELDISLDPEEDLPGIIDEHKEFFRQELEENGFVPEKINHLLKSDLLENLETLVKSEVFEEILNPQKGRSV
ncbi:hypothetical protein FACS1894193_13380 [Bacilli bacterium]|nr:hypothetical protein FACS1894193_13380 [Bacilli bacterium]